MSSRWAFWKCPSLHVLRELLHRVVLSIRITISHGPLGDCRVKYSEIVHAGITLRLFACFCKGRHGNCDQQYNDEDCWNKDLQCFLIILHRSSCPTPAFMMRREATLSWNALLELLCVHYYRLPTGSPVPLMSADM